MRQIFSKFFFLSPFEYLLEWVLNKSSLVNVLKSRNKFENLEFLNDFRSESIESIESVPNHVTAFFTPPHFQVWLINWSRLYRSFGEIYLLLLLLQLRFKSRDKMKELKKWCHSFLEREKTPTKFQLSRLISQFFWLSHKHREIKRDSYLNG